MPVSATNKGTMFYTGLKKFKLDLTNLEYNLTKLYFKNNMITF